MAEAFEVERDTANGVTQRACLKRVLPAYRGDARLLARFEREVRIASTLRHGNIVDVEALGEDEGAPYMVLQLIDGVDLRTLLPRVPGGHLSAALVGRLAIDLTYALAYAHTARTPGAPRGVVHRDLSPANVLISRTGEVRLADFGIAAAIDDPSAAVSQSIRGKVPYMSPEQLRGEPLDGRSDLFSLGTVLYEVATGQAPFGRGGDAITVRNVVEGVRPPLSMRAPALGEGLTVVIDRLLEPDLAARFESADAVLDALAGCEPPTTTMGARLGLAALVEPLVGSVGSREHVVGGDRPAQTERLADGVVAAAWEPTAASTPTRPVRDRTRK